MKYLRKFNEEFNFPNPFKKKDEPSEEKLQIEADEKFPSLIEELDNKLKSKKMQNKGRGNDSDVEVQQNPTFKTRSASLNHILMKMVEDHYKAKGFRTSKSYDGRNDYKDDYFRIFKD